ncbi:MAG TPA: paraquat-inducible protein A [Burkholderiaceae bacterium]|nr:paraquat-inducible protein A [Burkholderiaceae bacterium]
MASSETGEAPADGAGPLTARRAGLAACRACGRLAPAISGAPQRCGRCGTRLRTREEGDQARCAALLAGAAILYVPANLLPVLRTTSFFDTQDDTIMSGVLYLLDSGSWPIAALVFFASIMVPVMKLLALAVLLWAVRRGTRGGAMPRARLLRLVHVVGRWSMLDVYVASLLVALVQFHALAAVEIRPGMIAFGAVVVLTMFAAQTFDARRLWDGADSAATRSDRWQEIPE